MLSRSQLATLSWWIGAVIAAVLVVVGGPPIDTLHRAPATPFDNTRSGHAEQWRFLQDASMIVPPGSSFTIHAVDPETEMSLYMMAVGILPLATPIPRTYFGRQIDSSESARFRLTFGIEVGDTDDGQSRTAIAGGIVTDRGSSHP